MNLLSKCVFSKEVWKITKKWLNTKLQLKIRKSSKREGEGYISQYWERYNTFTDDRITEYMHQIASTVNVNL